MIGIYDYTVILTYMSLLSAVSGVALTMNGHPIIATLCLLFCGFCDMFDGKVARTKKNRTDEEKSYGIQIDSLSDIVAFGVLPAAISISLCRARWYVIVFAAFFVLAGLIRLAYFNVTEEQRQQVRNRTMESWYFPLPEEFYDDIMDYAGCRADQANALDGTTNPGCIFPEHYDAPRGGESL